MLSRAVLASSKITRNYHAVSGSRLHVTRVRAISARETISASSGFTNINQANISSMALQVRYYHDKMPNHPKIVNAPHLSSHDTLHYRQYKGTMTKYQGQRMLLVDQKNKSTAAAAGVDFEPESEVTPPSLRKVPSLPFVGSLVFKSKIPDIGQPYTFWPEMRKRYGDFYSFGLPGLGKSDWNGTAYVINDPKEMMNQVIRKSGKYPSGLAEGTWPGLVWMKNKGLETFQGEGNFGISGTGESWKKYRTFLQTDLLSPASARGYIPCIIEAAELASKAVDKWDKSKLNLYTTHCAFDLFTSFTLGQLTKTACLLSGDTNDDKENKEFVNNSITGLSLLTMMSRQPRLNFLYKVFGYYNTDEYKKLSNALDVAWEIGLNKIEDITRRKENGLLTEGENASYLSRALDRVKEQEGSEISSREAQELVWGGLFAAVDTTSSKFAWNLIQVALNPEVQEKLHKELSLAVSEVGHNGRLTMDVFERKHTPYLHAIVRETHRLTPIGAVTLMKQIGEDDVKIHGVPLPKGTTVVFDSFSFGYDPEYVDNPEQFQPERWLDDAVEKRKGTHREVIDHPFFKEPFGQGPRKCPGSRVALNEVKVMLSQLVLDWKIISPVTDLNEIKKEQQTTYVGILPELQFEARNN